MVNICRFNFNNFPYEDDPAYHNMEESNSSDVEDELDEPSYFEQVVQVGKIFDLDRYGCYGKWCIFLAAAKHSNWEKLLIPVPRYHDNDRLNIDLLLIIIDHIPKLSTIHNAILGGDIDEGIPFIIKLLYSVFIKMGDTIFQNINNYKFQKVIEFSGLNMNGLYPTDIFDLHAEDDLEKIPGLKFGFYGTSPARFYSILMNGFVNKIKSKTEDESVEVERIHLTTDFSVSLTHSDKEPYWYDLRPGAVFRTVALCEYIDDPGCVQYKKASNQEHTDIFISNCKAIRVRLMMFFKETIPALPPDEPDLNEWL